MRLIVAMDEQQGIGKDGRLPWHFPEDLKWFRQLTMGKKILMGRKTFESLPYILPGRKHYVISKTLEVDHPDVVVLPRFEMAPYDSIVIGGAQIYKQALPWVQTMYVTHIKGVYDTDVKFPKYKHYKWDARLHPASTEDFDIVIYNREY